MNIIKTSSLILAAASVMGSLTEVKGLQVAPEFFGCPTAINREDCVVTPLDDSKGRVDKCTVNGWSLQNDPKEPLITVDHQGTVQVPVWNNVLPVVRSDGEAWFCDYELTPANSDVAKAMKMRLRRDFPKIQYGSCKSSTMAGQPGVFCPTKP